MKKISIWLFVIVAYCCIQTSYADIPSSNVPPQIMPAIVSASMASPKISVYMQPALYGGDKGHEIFSVRTNEAIKWGVHAIADFINQARSNQKALRILYGQFLGEEAYGLGKFRRDIAFETNSPSKEAFGQLRTKDTNSFLEFTPVRTKWHDDICSFFKDVLSHLLPTYVDNIVHLTSSRSQNNLYVVNQEFCLDENNIAHTRNILAQHYKYNINELTDDAVIKIAQHESISLDKLFYSLPNTSLERFIRTQQRQPNGLYILKFEMKLNLNNQIIPISTIYGVFQPDVQKPNGITPVSLNRIAEKSFFLVTHAPKTHVNALMEFCAEYWEKAIFRDHSDVNGIAEDLGNLFYIQTHAMPYTRGSEAMTKWVVEIIARYHGLTLTYPENYGFQKPFLMTIDDFVNDFKAQIRLTPALGAT